MFKLLQAIYHNSVLRISDILRNFIYYSFVFIRGVGQSHPIDGTKLILNFHKKVVLVLM